MKFEDFLDMALSGAQQFGKGHSMEGGSLKLDPKKVMHDDAMHAGEKSFFKKSPKIKFRDFVAAAVKQVPNAISAWQDYSYKRDRPGEFAPKATKREGIGHVLNLLTDFGMDATKNFAKTNKYGGLYKALASSDEGKYYDKMKAYKKATKEKKADKYLQDERHRDKMDVERYKAGMKSGGGSGEGRKGSLTYEERAALKGLDHSNKLSSTSKRYELSNENKEKDFERNSAYKKPEYMHHKYIAEHPEKYDPASHSALMKDPTLSVYLIKQGSGQDAYFALPPSVLKKHNEGKKNGSSASNSKPQPKDDGSLIKSVTRID